jgi:acyl-CoA thioesterase FadM
MCRTAYLHVDYRAITPIGAEVVVTGQVVGVEGRKRLLRGELRHGDTLCAAADALFVELLPHQP